jgi:hypothetical protein
LNSDRYYQDVVQLADTEDINLANQILAQGFELLAIKDRSKHTAQDGKAVIETIPLYVLGKLKAAGRQEPADPSKIDFAALGWRKSNFSNDVESVAPDKVPAAVKEFLSKNNNRFEDGNYSYTLARSGWINRRRKA